MTKPARASAADRGRDERSSGSLSGLFVRHIIAEANVQDLARTFSVEYV